MNTNFCPFACLLVVACGLTSHAAENSPTVAAHRSVVENRAPLERTPLLRLPIGSVQPDGWLARQLTLQKQGLTGAAEQLYDAAAANSGWLGGQGDGWEKAPYYVKGIVALAYTLDDKQLQQRAQKWIEWVFVSQQEDGSFGPTSNDDWWPRMIVLYYLRDYYEATGDSRVLPFLTRYFRYQLAELPGRPLRDWGKARAADNIEIVLWVYNQTGDEWLLELAELLRRQAYPWSDIYAKNQFYGTFEEFHPHHIVNVSQAMKFPPVVWQLTHQSADKAAHAQGLEHLRRQYGRIDGQISGTEMLSGLRSTDGVELCADVERIVSDGVAIRVLGTATIGDSMEKVAYNSLPAHTTSQMTGMTYYQLLNQVNCVYTPHGFEQDYHNSIVPGPYSGFPCCCYNWHMGWPKFVENMWAATSDGGLAAVAYGPCKVHTTIAGGTSVTIRETTEYPFDEVIRLAVDVSQASEFPLLLRIPVWCDEPQLRINGEEQPAPKSGVFHRVKRTWKTGDTVELTFPMTVRTSRWANNSLGIERGPLTYGLEINEQWHKNADYDGPFDEYTITPGSPWNYALEIDPSHPERSIEVATQTVGDVPWALESAPVVLTATARKLPEWQLGPRMAKVEIGYANGAWHPMAEAAVEIEGEQPYRLRIKMNGGEYRVYLNDSRRSVLEGRDGRAQQGMVGLRTYEAATQFDDFKLNGRVLDDFAGDLSKWKSYGGRWAPVDGQMTVGKHRGAKAVLRDTQVGQQFALETTLKVEPGGNAGLLFRVGELADGLDKYHGYYVGVTNLSGSSDAQEPPASPVQSAQPTERVRLVPFGATKLRVSYFPWLDEE
ncbi:glycoside hydrolase family 127 protein [Aeoliella sp. ICT_H6.2]|uniref:Glycoside hydrolase family 127 protein n=1 Tax=Aeoliella straminimaris TaxID=2954799 RepID=A0A9X2JKG3_9BACT|nr:beta-L-arabinofuranosidase domain-containing protein [Aeoliella straminimaris]MCO6046454.1 glycoside hydrolase family 127 protein [Aeoliella straminimaris]